MFTTKKTAEILGVNIRTLRRWARLGLIPYSQGRRGLYFFSEDHIGQIQKIFLLGDPAWMSVSQVAAREGVTGSTVRGWISKKILVAHKAGGMEWRIRSDSLGDLQKKTRKKGMCSCCGRRKIAENRGFLRLCSSCYARNRWTRDNTAEV